MFHQLTKQTLSLGHLRGATLVFGLIVVLGSVYNMETLAELREFGESIGHEGQALRDFISKEQERLRLERAEARDREREREAREFSAREEERKLELAKLKFAHEEEMSRIERSETKCKTTEVKGPKLPPFEERNDEMDSYLRRFELYAKTQNWHSDIWATHLSALLKGKALDVFALLPSDKALDYDYLKKGFTEEV